MYPIRNNIIIEAVLDQKETISYGALKLYIPNRDKLNQNGREANAVLAQVSIANDKFPEIKKNDIIILSHNVINNKAYELFTNNGIRTSSIPVDKEILGKFGDKGEIIPLNGNTIAQRIYGAPSSSIIITPDAYRTTEPNRMNIIAVAPDVKGIFPGSIAVVHLYSDYECVYNYNGQEHRVIIIHSRDIVATA